MASNFVQNTPLIARQFMSGGLIPQGDGIRSNMENVFNIRGGEFTSNIGTSNTIFPIQRFEVATTDSSASYSSNAMLSTNQFNIIKADIHNKGNQNIKLNIHYSQKNSLQDSKIKYSTVIGAGETFYRNYPVENDYFAFSIDNLGESFSITDGLVSLSKYTQYNAPSQIVDTVGRYALADNSRILNNFYDDIHLGRQGDARITDRIGVVSGLSNSFYQNITNVVGLFNYTANIARPIVVRSSSNTDTGTVTIRGKNQFSKIVEEDITLAGTSNAFAIEEYTMIDDIRCNDFENYGDLIVAGRDDGVIYNFADTGAGRSTTLSYIAPHDGRTILKTLRIDGVLSLETNTDIEIYKLSNTYSSLLYKNNSNDGVLNDVIELDTILNEGEAVYGVLSSSNITSDTRISTLLKVVEYNTADQNY